MLNRQPLRRQVVAAAAIMVLVLAVAIVWAGNATRLERRAEISAQSAALATTVAGSLDQYLGAIYALASTLAQHPDVRALDAAGAQRLFASVLAEQPHLSNIVLGDRDGQLVATAQSSSPMPIPVLGFVREALQRDRPVLSDLFVGSLRGVPLAVLAFPVHAADGSVAGLLGLALDLPHMQDVFSSIPLPRGSVVTVLDRNGLVLARSSDAAKYLGHPGVPASTTATPYILDLDGVNRLSADATMQRASWRVSVGIPLSEVIARVITNWVRNIVVVTVVVLASFSLSLWVAVRASRGLEVLRTGAQRIAEGDLATPRLAPMPNLELEQVQQAFVTMADRLRVARDAHEQQVEQERRLNDMLQSMQRQLVRQERLAAVGLLVSGVAHELNNPLQAILGASEILARQPGLSVAAHEEVAFLQSQAVRAREIIRSLSRFSDPHVGPPEPVDVRGIVAEVVQLRHDLAGDEIRLTVSATTARLVNANFTELARVVLNLVLNAERALLDSHTESPSIEINVFDHGPRVRCEVSDNGPGVPPADEAKLFQPFFTTRTVGDGAGLGLSMSYGIIQSYGGTIGYYRNQTGGATFFFELPAGRSDEDVQDGTPLLRQPSHSRV